MSQLPFPSLEIYPIPLADRFVDDICDDFSTQLLLSRDQVEFVIRNAALIDGIPTSALELSSVVRDSRSRIIAMSFRVINFVALGRGAEAISYHYLASGQGPNMQVFKPHITRRLEDSTGKVEHITARYDHPSWRYCSSQF